MKVSSSLVHRNYKTEKDSIIKIGNIGKGINFMVAPNYDAILSYHLFYQHSTQKKAKTLFWQDKLLWL